MYATHAIHNHLIRDLKQWQARSETNSARSQPNERSGSTRGSVDLEMTESQTWLMRLTISLQLKILTGNFILNLKTRFRINQACLSMLDERNDICTAWPLKNDRLLKNMRTVLDVLMHLGTSEMHQ